MAENGQYDKHRNDMKWNNFENSLSNWNQIENGNIANWTKI